MTKIPPLSPRCLPGPPAIAFLTALLCWFGSASIDAFFNHGKVLGHFFTPSPHDGVVRIVFASVCAAAAWAAVKNPLGRRADDCLSGDLAAVGAMAIIDALGDAVSVQDRSLRVLHQNRAHREAMGDRRGEFCYAAYQHRDTVCPECHLLMCFADGQTHRRETVGTTARGRINVEIVSTPLRNAAGKIVAAIETVRDISERKRAEEKNSGQLAAIEASMEGISILNSDHVFVYVNHALSELYGYASPSDLIGKSWRTLYSEEEVRRFVDEVIGGFNEKGAWRGEAVGTRRDGSKFPQEISLSSTQNGGLVGVVRDITERRRAEEAISSINQDLQVRAQELASANSEMETFCYSLSHDLRSYLTCVYAGAQTLRDLHGRRLDEDGALIVKTILDASEGMEELIEAILVLSRVSKREMCRKKIDLCHIARDVAVHLRVANSGRGVELVLPPELPVNADPHLTKVLLENLLANAWKYTGGVESPLVEFGAEERGGEQVYFVRDNGIGFDMSEAAHLFDPFSRLSNARRFPGTGVGLATVQRIVQRHGGRVWGEGVRDRGAVFYFTLPPDGVPHPVAVKG